MAERVTSPELRFRFVAKDLADVGDYSLFPMEVTGASVKVKFDKIAEIFYRAKMAQFTANTLDDGGSFTGGVTSGTISPRVMFQTSTGLTDNYLMSGYWTLDDPSPLNVYPAALPFLGDQYTETYFDIGVGTASGTFRDMNDRESGILLPNADTAENPKWNKPDSFANAGRVVNAFSWYSNSAAGDTIAPAIPIPWIEQAGPIYEQLELYVIFSGRIGVVYGGAVGDLYDPANRFFIEMLVDGYTSMGLLSTGPNGSGYSPTSATYTMRLSTGDLTCPLNFTGASLSGDLRHEAVEWFSSAKSDPATAVWNTATGAKL